MKAHLDINRIAEVFSSVINDASAEDSLVFCGSAGESIVDMLRKDADIAENMGSLCYAAACLAVYRYKLKEGLDPIPQFKAGDLTLKETTDAITAAEKMYDDAITKIRHLLKKSGGVFLSVKG